MKTTPLVTIDLEEYNRLLELDKADKAGIPKSVIQFRHLMLRIADRLDRMPVSKFHVGPHSVAESLRSEAKDEESLVMMLNEKT